MSLDLGGLSAPIGNADELVAYIKAAERPADRWLIGVEHEKIGVRGPRFEAAPYYGPGGIRDLEMNVRAKHEELFRDAAADHAGAAHPVFFRNHHARAVAGRDPGGSNPARTSSDHEQIDVELSHLSPDPNQPA